MNIGVSFLEWLILIIGLVFCVRPLFRRFCVLYRLVGECDRIIFGHTSSTDLEPIRLRSGINCNLDRG